jgi:hypothetical protein
VTRGLVGGAVLAMVIACSAARPMQAMAPREDRPAAGTAAVPAMAPRQDVHAEIDALDRDLAARRAGMGLPETPAEAMAVPAACAPAGGACRDVCTVAEAICDDAARICELAKQLPGDAWASGRCDAGTATCAAARARCCGCQ